MQQCVVSNILLARNEAKAKHSISFAQKSVFVQLKLIQIILVFSDLVIISMLT